MTLSLTNSKMNIQNLPSEILEKILVEGNFLSVSRVCQTWRYHAQRKKSQFNEVFFDLTKDDPEKIKKKNPDQLFVFNSPTIDENGFRMGPKIVTKRLENYVNEYSLYLKEKYRKIFNKITFANTLNYIYNPLLYVNRNESQYPSQTYILSNNLFVDNEDHKITGIINYYPWILEDYLCISKNKTKNVNIVIKDVFDRIENIDQKLFEDLELILFEIIYYNLFRKYKKFTFKAPFNTYLIYDENKKLLIIRFGDHEKYNFPVRKMVLDPCGRYSSVTSNIEINTGNYHPTLAFEYYYENFTKNVEKLIVISFEFHSFIFDRLLDTARIQKKIEYHCFDSSKKKFEKENFKFVPIEKEKEQEQEQEYSFEQMHFKYFEENAF